jgi:RNA polymerase subunit RPABC4/transcription elongation factor Spt4
MKFCPNCNAQIADDSRFCTECGKEIPQGTVCSHCGASINENDSFCPNCGKNLKETSTIEQIVYNEEQPKNGFKKYLPYIIGAFVLLGIIGYFSSNDSSNQNNSTNAVVADSTSTEIEASVGQLAKEQITKRLEEIFDDVAKGNINDHDEKYFSSDFNRIYNEVAEIDDRFAQEGELGFWDSGFWDMAQDEVKLSATIKDVYDVKDKEAMAKIAFKFTYYDGSSETRNEDIKIVLENGKWVLDDLHGYKKQMKAFVEENKNYQPSTTQDKIDSSSGNDYSSNSSNTSSSARTFANEQYVVGYLVNQTFRSSNGFTIRFDGSGRMYAEGDFAGVVSVLYFNSKSAMLRYGGGQYTEGRVRVDIVGDKLQLKDPEDGTIYYQR